MNLSTQHAWIVTGALAGVFALAYLFYFGPQYSQAAASRQAAMGKDQKISGDWVGSASGAVPLKDVDSAIQQRREQAIDDLNQVFNVPVAYQRAKAGENASTYFFNMVDKLKKNPGVKGLLNETKITGEWFEDAKYPIELKLRVLAMVDRMSRAAGACDLTQVAEIKQLGIQEVTPDSERAASDPNGAGGSRGGRRPGLGGDTPTGGAAGGGAPAESAPAVNIRLVKVTLEVKFRGPEGNLIKFLTQLQAPSPDASELTLVYLNSCALLSNDKTFGALDGDMTIGAIFPLKDEDLKAVLANPGQAVLK